MGSKLGSAGSSAKNFLRWLNMGLIVGASASIAIIVLLRRSPTPWGWAFITASAVSILSGLLGFSSHTNRPCFALHTFLLLLSVIGQGLGFLMLFARTEQSQRRLQPTQKEQITRILMKANAALFVVMFCMQMLVLVLSCSLQCCRLEEEYHGLDVEGKEKVNRRTRKMARVQEESLVQATVMEERHAHELNKKMKEKYGQWTKEEEFDA